MAQHETRTRRQSTVSRQPHTPPKGTATDEAVAPRRLRVGRYRSFRLRSKTIKPAYEDRSISSGWRLFKRSAAVLWRHYYLFGISTLIFGALMLPLAGGFVNSSILTQVETSMGLLDANGDPKAEAGSAGAGTGLALLGTLITAQGSNSLNGSTGAWQVVLVLVSSLVFIWCLRQVTAGRKTTLRGAWYQGTASLVPFTLVCLVLLAESIPFVGGGYLVVALVGQGIAQGFLELFLSMAVFLGLLTLSVFWWMGTLFALPIVTLPNMTPVKALRSANELVRYRRAVVLRKVLFLAAFFGLVAVFIVVPVALVSLTAAPPVFFILAILGLPFSLAYLYNLYRELIG